MRDDPTLRAALIAEFGTDCGLSSRRVDRWTCEQAGVARRFRCDACRLALVLAEHEPADDPTRQAAAQTILSGSAWDGPDHPSQVPPWRTRLAATPEDGA